MELSEKSWGYTPSSHPNFHTDFPRKKNDPAIGARPRRCGQGVQGLGGEADRRPAEVGEHRWGADGYICQYNPLYVYIYIYIYLYLCIYTYTYLYLYLYYIRLYYIILYYIKLYHIILNYIILFYIILSYIIFFYFILYIWILYGIEYCGMIWVYLVAILRKKWPRKTPSFLMLSTTADPSEYQGFPEDQFMTLW